MLKRLLILFLGFVTGLAGNLIAAWAQQDILENLFTPMRVAALAVITLAVFFLVAWLDNGGLQPKIVGEARADGKSRRNPWLLLTWLGLGMLVAITLVAIIFIQPPLCAGKPLCVLVAELSEGGDYTDAIGSRLEAALYEAERETPTVKYVSHIKTMQDAEELAEQEQALVVVWGKVSDEAGVQEIFFHVLDRLGIDKARNVRTQRAVPIQFDNMFKARRLQDSDADVVAYTAAGLLQYASGRYVQAYDSFVAGLICGGEQVELSLRTNIRPACEERAAPLAWQPKILYYYAGKAAILSGDYRRGVDLLQTAAHLAPNEPAISLALGQAYQEWSGQYDWDKAVTAFQQAIDQSNQLAPHVPDSLPAIYQNIGLAYESLRKPLLASQSYAQAVELSSAGNSNPYISLVQLGRVQALLGESAAASATLRQAIAMVPHAPWAYLEMASLQHEYRFGALDFIEEARIAAPDEAQVDLRLAQLCLQWEDYACAQSAYASAEKKLPASGWLQSHIGAFYQPQTPPLAHQSWEKAHAYFDKAAAWRPADPWAHERLGYVLFNLGDVAAAIGHYQQAIDLAPTDAVPARLRCGLGRLLQKQGDSDSARQQFELCELTASNAAERDIAHQLLEQLSP